MLWNYGLKNLKLTIKWFFTWSHQVPILLYSSKNIKNSYILYSYVLKLTWAWKNACDILLNIRCIFSLFLQLISLEKTFEKNILKLFYTIFKRWLYSRTQFNNLKKQSQCFMTIFRNFKNQSAFYNHHALGISVK